MFHNNMINVRFKIFDELSNSDLFNFRATSSEATQLINDYLTKNKNHIVSSPAELLRVFQLVSLQYKQEMVDNIFLKYPKLLLQVLEIASPKITLKIVQTLFHRRSKNLDKLGEVAELDKDALVCSMIFKAHKYYYCAWREYIPRITKKNVENALNYAIKNGYCRVVESLRIILISLDETSDFELVEFEVDPYINLAYHDFWKSDLGGWKTFRYANLQHAHLYDDMFGKADLTGADLSHGRYDPRFLNASKFFFDGADFTNANLHKFRFINLPICPRDRDQGYRDFIYKEFSKELNELAFVLTGFKQEDLLKKTILNNVLKVMDQSYINNLIARGFILDVNRVLDLAYHSNLFSHHGIFSARSNINSFCRLFSSREYCNPDYYETEYQEIIRKFQAVNEDNDKRQNI